MKSSHVNQHHYTSYPSLTAALKGVNLRGKSVLITGGGHGLGLWLAKAFAAQGISEILLVGRTEENLVAAASCLAESWNLKVCWYIADISSKLDVERIFSAFDHSPDILVNNAGYLPEQGHFVNSDLDEWWRGFTVNILGTANVTQRFLRHRRAQTSSEPGIVITLNTIVAVPPRNSPPMPLGLSSYAASKAGLARWVETVAAEVPDEEARFFSVHPGLVETAMAKKVCIPPGLAVTEGKLVGEFIAWLTSKEASFLSGRFVCVNWDVDELLRIDGEVVDDDLFVTTLA